MADNPIREMISAYALGCIDKENLIQFRDYISKGGKLPKKEMGDLQNIVSLIPTILETETPNPKLKEAVAKKLLSFQEETKARIREQKERGTSTGPVMPPARNKFKVNTATHATKHDTIEKPAKPSSQPKSPNEVQKTVVPEKITLTGDVPQLSELPIQSGPKNRTTITNPLPIPPNTEIGKDSKEDKVRFKDYAPDPQTMVSSKTPVWIWALLAVVIIGASIVAYILYQENSILNNKIATVNREKSSLVNQLIQKENELNANQVLIEFLNYDDIQIIKLMGSDLALDATGKIFLSLDIGEALLELYNLPIIESGMVYHVWLVSRGKSYSLLEFLPDPNLKFIKIPKLPYVPREDVDFIRITVEDKAGKETPEGNTFLYGATAQ